MPAESFKSSPVADAVVRHVPTDSEFRSYRPSYSPDNAFKFKPIFDKMLESGEAQQITTADTGLRVSTLYLKTQDALKWLADMHPSERTKYLQLRNIIRIRRDDRGGRILLHFKLGLSPVKATSSAATSPWKDELEKWLGTAQAGEIWDSTKLFKEPITVTAADKSWIENMLSRLDDTEADIQPTSVRVMR